MSKNKRRRRPLKTNKSDLVHEEMFEDKPAKVGCTCKQDSRTHGGGWIQCTENDCAVWHCIDDITDNYVLLDDEIDDLQDSNHTFKCILHGFYRMKIGNKSLYQSEDSESNDKNEETYKPPTKTNTNTNTNSIKQKRKRKTQIENKIENENENEIQTENGISNTIITKSDIESKPPLHKKRKIDLSLIPPLEPMNQQKFTYSNAELANPHIIYGKNIYQINKNELKQLCRKMGLKVTGTKSELINSLLKPKKSELKTFLNHENNNSNNNNDANKILTDNTQQNGEQNGDNDSNMIENVTILTDNNTTPNEQQNEGINTEENDKQNKEQNEEKDNDNDSKMIENDEQNKQQNDEQNEEINAQQNEEINAEQNVEQNEKQNEEQNEEKDNDNNNNNNNDNNMIENEEKNKEQNEQNKEKNNEQNEQNKERNGEQNEEQNGDLISTVNDC